ncbi:MAG: NnrS family protein [Lysobacterales bacterium]|jgi:uncharacterized protein involved in response to NO
MERSPHPLTLTPHRGFFLLGMIAFVGAMAWWLAVQVKAPALLMPPAWLHAWLVMFSLLAPFIAGFLFTAYSRWLGANPPAPATWRFSLAFHLAGTLCVVAGAYLGLRLSLAGALFWLASWCLVFGHLVRAYRQGNGATLHASTMMASNALGLLSLGSLAGWLLLGWPALASWSLSSGFWGFLVGTYLVVAHRMIPFFAGCVLEPYERYRPAWMLLAMLALALCHLALMILQRPELTWLVDAPMAILAGWLGWRWQWWRAGAHRLLAALFVAWAGLVSGLAAASVQHYWLFATGHWLGTRWPEHLIGIGFFGAMVIAMGTRVTLGHSGRPLRMGTVAWLSLLGVVGAAVLRALAELTPEGHVLLLASLALWIVAGLAWVLRHGPMLIGPRVDRRPG